MQIQHSWIDSIHHALFGGMLHITWILMVEGKLIFEDDKVN
jgi:hypothetical protein